MSLTSFPFIVSFILSIGIYYFVPKRFQWVILFVFSTLFFLASSRSFTIVYLSISIVSVFLMSRIIRNKKSVPVLITGIMINLGMLFVLKYLGFIIENINLIFIHFGSTITIPEISLSAPIGISFYTMQIIAYMLDVYWDITEPQEGLLRTALFIGYWPQLKSGPIARHNDMKAQLYSGHDFSWRNLTFGLQRMMWGIFKSLVISNRIGIMVDTIYGDTIRYNGFYIWFAAGMFMMQLYADFSGCMDIVIGASECYGIALPENFRTPFFSRSVQEYWQRWHITLGGFMKDYVMNPLLRTNTWRKLAKTIRKHFGKKAAVQIPSYLGMLIVWLLIGLWHGGGWNYIIGQGMWFFLCIVLGRSLEPVFKRMIRMFRVNTDTFSWHLFQSVRVFILVAIGNMFFRIDGLGETFKVMKSGLSHWNPWIFFDGSLYKLGISDKEFMIVIVGLQILLIVSALQERYGSVRDLIARQNYVFRWSIYIFLICGILIYGTYGSGFEAQSFIYEGF